jgi:hypothetical protein
MFGGVLASQEFLGVGHALTHHGLRMTGQDFSDAAYVVVQDQLRS